MTYFKVVQSVEEAEEDLESHLMNMKNFARYIYAYLTSVILGDKQVMMNRSFVSSIKLSEHAMNPDDLRRAYQAHASCAEVYDWGIDAEAMEQFRPSLAAIPVS